MPSHVPHTDPTTAYFFTVRLFDPNGDLLVRQVDLLKSAFHLTMKKWPFKIDESVILPNRLHTIWILPADDLDYGKRWQMIKRTFNRQLPCEYRQAARDKGQWIWQRRYWEQPISSAADYDEYLELIRGAPVQEGLAPAFNAWPHALTTENVVVH
jgi:putative transposase